MRHRHQQRGHDHEAADHLPTSSRRDMAALPIYQNDQSSEVMSEPRRWKRGMENGSQEGPPPFFFGCRSPRESPAPAVGVVSLARMMIEGGPRCGVLHNLGTGASGPRPGSGATCF